MGKKGYLVGALICICLMTDEGEHVFMCLLPICLSSRSSVYPDPFFFLFGLFSFLLCCESSSYIIDTSPLSNV